MGWVYWIHGDALPGLRSAGPLRADPGPPRPRITFFVYHCSCRLERGCPVELRSEALPLVDTLRRPERPRPEVRAHPETRSSLRLEIYAETTSVVAGGSCLGLTCTGLSRDIWKGVICGGTPSPLAFPRQYSHAPGCLGQQMELVACPTDTVFPNNDTSHPFNESRGCAVSAS